MGDKCCLGMYARVLGKVTFEPILKDEGGTEGAIPRQK